MQNNVKKLTKKKTTTSQQWNLKLFIRNFVNDSATKKKRNQDKNQNKP